MDYMATTHLRLRYCADGYYRTSWLDDNGERHGRSFGRHRGRAQNRFGKFHARWKRDAAVRNPTPEGYLTIDRGWERFNEHAQEHYRHVDGTLTGRARNMGYAFAPVRELFGDLPAGQFSPKKLKTVREAMIDAGLSMKLINERVGIIRHVFRWLVGEELIEANVWHALQAVEPLRKGRSRAKELPAVGPAPDEHVWAVAALVPSTVRAMIEVQYLTGMRSGELCGMRAIDLDMTGSVWLYQPVQHKTSHLGKSRKILVGPKAQAHLRPFLEREVEAYLFSPREAQQQRYGARSMKRHQPVEVPRTARRIGNRYTSQAYGYCIRRVCQRHGIPHWSPNQLRHNAATRLRKEFGLELAQIILGHSRADVTQIYAARDLTTAVAVMERVG